MLSALYHSSKIQLLVFAFIISLLVYFGTALYQKDKTSELKSHSYELSSITNLKAASISQWFVERMADGQYLFDHTFLEKLLLDYTSSRSRKDSISIISLIQKIYFNHDYYTIMVVGKDNRLLLNLNSSISSSFITDSISSAVRDKVIKFTNVYYDPVLQNSAIDIYVPVIINGGHKFTLILKIDPNRLLIPIVVSGNYSRSSFESLMVSAFGDSVYFLTPLKFNNDSSHFPSKHISLDYLPAVKAARGSVGVVEGMDYRGVEVLSDVRKIENTPWFLISKIDLSDVYATVHENTLKNLIFFFLIVILGTILLMYFQTSSNYKSFRKLSIAEKKFNSIFENSANAILLIDKNKIVDCNKQAQNLFSLPKKKILGKQTVDLSPEFQEDELPSKVKYDLILSEVLSGKSSQYEWIYLKNDEPVYTDLRLSTIEIDNKKYILAFLFDVTNQKKTKEALLESEAKFFSIFRFSPLAMTITTFEDGKFVYVNDIFIRDTGYSLEETINQSSLDLSLFINNSEAISFNQELSENGVLYGKEIMFRAKDGKVLDCLVSSTLIHLNGKKHLLTAILNISDRKRVERALRNSEIEFKNLFNSANDAIIIFSTDSETILSVNNKASELYEFSKDEFIGKSFKDITLDVKSGELRIQQIIANGSIKNYESNHFTKSGKIITVLINASTIQYSGQTAILAISHDITELKETAKSLQQTQSKLHQVLEHSVNLFYTHDIDNVLSYVSPQSKEILGCSPEEAMIRWTDFLSDNPLNLKGIKFTEKAIKTGLRQPAYELELKHKSGKLIRVEVNETPIVKNGEVTAIVGSLTDITDKKIAQEALVKSEEKYRELVENVNEIIYEVDENGVITFVSSASKRLTGYNVDEVVGRNFMEFIHPDDKSKIVADFASLPSKKVIQDDVQIIIDSGDHILVRFTSTAIFDGSQFKGARGMILDITEQIKNEKMIKTLSKAVNQSPVSVVITDPEGNIQYVNAKFSQITGYQPDEVINNNPRILKSGSQSNEFYANLWNTISSGDTWQGELHNKKKNGELYWENAIISPILSSNGSITNYVAVKEDITERKKMIQDLINAKETAEEANRLKTSFLANMSHELRTPLVGILGFAELLSYEITEPHLREMTDTILRSGSRLMSTLNSILDLSRVEANKEELKLSNVNLNALITEAANIFKPLAHEKNLSLSVNLRDKSLILLSDPEIILKIIDNLLSNAVKYTHSGGIIINSFKNNHNSRNVATIEVIDTGIGISNKFKDVIFEPFRQVSEGYARSYEGSGLGLSITKKFVDLLEGEISFDSELGKGSTFRVNLPLAEDENPSIIQSDIIDFTSYEAAKNHLTDSVVLMVEDDPTNASVITAYLKDYTSVDHISDGHKVTALCRKKQYDAVLMDINLNGITGVEVMLELRKMAQYKSVPIIAMTAYAMKGDRENFLSKGFDFYISKPFSRSELLNLLSYIFKNKF